MCKSTKKKAFTTDNLQLFINFVPKSTKQYDKT